MARFRITRLWNGQPIPGDEHVDIALSFDDSSDLRIHVDAPLHGDPAPGGPAGSTDALWEFEVVEVFLVGRNGRYTEVELGPHGHYLVLRLDGPRAVRDRDHEIRFVARRQNHRWRGDAVLPRRLLPEEVDRIGLFAIHGTGRQRRYLSAFPLPGTAPDFHQPASFPELASPGLRA